MNEDVKKLGELFKSKRKELNLSLKEVENATSIRTSHLEAIEEGKKDRFLSPVYMLGFMRQYAKFLELDGEKLIEEHPGAVKLEQEKQEFSYGIGTLERRNSMGGGVKWLPNLLWGAVGVGVLVIAYYFAKYLGLF
ncbi:helix-turn-helix domain-containing protein [Candidatus Neptunochlamydia vexilliferae]|nr:helix-turn-helix domain-containing protein [Candidatus Neptunochlamydia vexilliferae]